MSSKAEPRKTDLRERLVEATARRAAADGFGAVKACNIASVVGCALGAICNVFDDMNALVLTGNGRTFRKLGVAAAASHSGGAERTPVVRQDQAVQPRIRAPFIMGLNVLGVIAACAGCSRSRSVSRWTCGCPPRATGAWGSCL